MKTDAGEDDRIVDGERKKRRDLREKSPLLALFIE
jgi:hypothetical protein